MKKIVSVTFILLILSSQLCFAENTNLQSYQEIFDKSVQYNIVYENQPEEIDTIKNVKIVGIVEIYNKVFLKISVSTFESKYGFILFDAVKAVLPS
jgi:hypothetical protein